MLVMSYPDLIVCNDVLFYPKGDSLSHKSG